MTMEKLAAIISIILGLVSLASSVGLVFTVISNLKTRIIVLEKRVLKDEEHLEDRTKELYNSRLDHGERIAYLEGKKKSKK